MGWGRHKLTWQPDARRRGRWKRMYRGRIFYFDGGEGKSDSEAYKRAVTEFERQKLIRDAELDASKPHRAEYEKCIHEWEIVLAAARDAQDEPAQIAAAAKIDDLRKRQRSRNPPVLSRRSDWPLRRFGLNLGKVVGELAQSNVVNEARATASSVTGALDVDEDSQHEAATTVEAYVATAIWKDRLQRQRGRAAVVELSRSLGALVTAYVARRRDGNITAGAAENVRRRLDYFRDLVGPASDAAAISGKTLDELHRRLMLDVAAAKFTRATAADILQTVRAFIRWLHETDILPQLPRNLNSSAHRIVAEPVQVKVFSVVAIRKLYREATPSLRLYMLLGLNCGMTQVDISNLKPGDVDFQAGTLTRKRGKTRLFDNVPTVTYALWPETQRLLKSQRSADATRLLLAPEGGPLKFEVYRNNRVSRNDYVGGSFRKLLKRLELTGEFKNLKKTSGTLLRGHATYSGLEAVFLDHAPRSMSDKHYTQVPEKLLAEALGWLREQYRLSAHGRVKRAANAKLRKVVP